MEAKGLKKMDVGGSSGKKYVILTHFCTQMHQLRPKTVLMLPSYG